ncbi:hypothetical protein [Ectopseudomonas mendocina]|uniref:Uncharacterized protein n=1 Tax=Ectopseudomonas mendocina S5.2 TaxID=1225174 RepID=A0ABM5VUF9_ECTME|nr:hypothetical protein [Pseudomonas mendocina]ALN18479.1 hypothetical protein DW68_007515 [Pseudomonas mendocina S5.2]KES00675.1 hypothetical protein HN51_12715 [Pseudomonas mendocina]
MADFLIGDVKKVRELFEADKVNKHLKGGWVLLSQATGKDEQGYPLAKYVLGWLSEEAPLHEYEY